MKKLVKKIKPESLATSAMIGFAALAMFMPEVALAGRPDIKGIVADSIFKDAITLAFGLFAFIQWIDYAANFSPGSALKAMIVPALATFLAFKWTMVLGWFKLV